MRPSRRRRRSCRLPGRLLPLSAKMAKRQPDPSGIGLSTVTSARPDDCSQPPAIAFSPGRQSCRVPRRRAFGLDAERLRAVGEQAGGQRAGRAWSGRDLRRGPAVQRRRIGGRPGDGGDLRRRLPVELQGIRRHLGLVGGQRPLCERDDLLSVARAAKGNEQRDHRDDERGSEANPPESEPTHSVLLSFMNGHRYDTLAQIAQTEPFAGTVSPLNAKMLMNQPEPSGIGRSAMISARPTA